MKNPSKTKKSEVSMPQEIEVSMPQETTIKMVTHFTNDLSKKLKDILESSGTEDMFTGVITPLTQEIADNLKNIESYDIQFFDGGDTQKDAMTNILKSYKTVFDNINESKQNEKNKPMKR